MSNLLSGWLGIDKPENISSAHCLNKLKKFIPTKKIGHTGTLDPFASGVLCVALGEATKTIQFLNPNKSKIYECVIEFGKTTDTLDSDGEIIEETNILPLKDDFLKAIRKFTGKIEQIPPKYSALKIDGKRAYDLARKGEEFTLAAREVEVKSIELLEWLGNKAKIKVECSKGTYIRSLGADIAKSLGSLGYLSYLRRTGDLIFCEENIISLEFFNNLVHNAEDKKDKIANDKSFLNYLQPIDSVLDDILAVDLGEDKQLDLRHGKKIKNNINVSDEIIKVKNNDDLVAICRNENGFFVPIRIFNN